MRGLKILLVMIYVSLVILLILLGVRSCSMNGNDNEDPVRRAENTGGSGGLKVTLLWNFTGDIDLHVIEPNGIEIYYQQNRDNATGGYLDVDNREGGNGAAENVYWRNPPRGKYRVILEYYGMALRSQIAESGVCTVVVFRKGRQPQTYKVVMSEVNERRAVTEIDI